MWCYWRRWKVRMNVVKGFIAHLLRNCRKLNAGIGLTWRVIIGRFESCRWFSHAISFFKRHTVLLTAIESDRYSRLIRNRLLHCTKVKDSSLLQVLRKYPWLNGCYFSVFKVFLQRKLKGNFLGILRFYGTRQIAVIQRQIRKWSVNTKQY